MGLRCFNENNSPMKGDFMIVPNEDYSCSYFKKFNQQEMFEWDQNKNELNMKKHGIGFERAIDIYNDPHQIQMPEIPSKWEKIDDEEFESKGIEKNFGNLDPVRAKIIGSIDGKIYTYIYTFRNNPGDMVYRVISLRRAQEKEIQVYQSFKAK
jgi:uncharacterized DUF497 family protein